MKTKKTTKTKRKLTSNSALEQLINIGNKFTSTIEGVSERIYENEKERMKIENSKDNISISTKRNSDGSLEKDIKISFSKETSKEVKSILKELKAV